MTRINPSIETTQRDHSRMLTTAGVVIAALYFGSEVFVPIALAILLSFVLAPGVRKLHAWGLGRVFPVIVVTLLGFTVIFGLLGLMGAQLKDLASELPRYEGTITRKVTALRGMGSNGAMQRIEEIFEKLNHAANRKSPDETTERQDIAPAPGQTEPAAPAAQAPMPVEVRQPAPSSLDTMKTLAAPLLHPLATAGIVIIFVFFILLQREDLRNRLIRLFGAGDLQRTTAAIDDGGKRLSRYLLTQSFINAMSGIVIGIAAWLVGVPNPLLWGILFGVMRFVPYIGPIIGGALPVAFAAAVDPGWSMAIWMATIIVVAELLVGQVLEPFLYGHNTGLSPVAVVVSATFWTALWGPVGLLLATPLTVCLVVIGRHVDQLAFLDVLLGDSPPLTAPETFYQRMLANDPTEVADQAAECLKSMSLTEYYDEVVLPGLLLAQNDATNERLSPDRQVRIRDATEDVVDDLGDDDHHGDGAAKAGRWHLFRRKDEDTAGTADLVDMEAVPAAWQREGSILCIGARGPLDDAAAAMLTQVLNKRGFAARIESFTALSKANIDQLEVGATRLICLSCLDGSSSAYLRFALRRVKRHAPRAKILVGAWWLQAEDADALDPSDEDKAIAEPVATTVVDAARFCLAAASALSEDELALV